MSDPATEADGQRSTRFDDVGKDVSDILQRAASVLEEEVAVGLAGAKKISARAVEERRVDADEFGEVMARFREDMHAVVDVAGTRLSEMSSGQPQELTQRFASDAHDVVDTVMNLVNLAPDILNRLAEQLPQRQAPATPPDPTTESTAAPVSDPDDRQP
jgi:hypothetical protein